MAEKKFRLNEEVGLCYYQQFPERVKEQIWFFKKMNSKEGVFLRTNAIILKAIKVYSLFINDVTILTKITIEEKRKTETKKERKR
ncbi:hypothetical protein ES705_43200 [subsurface metagenome]